jgi:CheY-like chemotaxis protein
MIPRQPLGTTHNQLRAHHPRCAGSGVPPGSGRGNGGGVDPVDSTTGGLHHDHGVVEAKTDGGISRNITVLTSQFGIKVRGRTTLQRTPMNREQRKRIVLIDDHLVVRQGLERLLNLDEEFVVCEEAGDAAAGIALVREVHPDAVVIDVALPDSDGIEATTRLLEEFPHLIVIALSASDEPEIALRALHAGAMAYVVKSEGIESLTAALRNAFNRKRTFAVLEKFGGIT